MNVTNEGPPGSNSGNTSEPHLHIHHQRQDPAELPVNFAEGPPFNFRGHEGPSMPEEGLKESNGRIVLRGARVRRIAAGIP